MPARALPAPVNRSYTKAWPTWRDTEGRIRRPRALRPDSNLRHGARALCWIPKKDSPVVTSRGSPNSASRPEQGGETPSPQGRSSVQPCTVGPQRREQPRRRRLEIGPERGLEDEHSPGLRLCGFLRRSIVRNWIAAQYAALFCPTHANADDRTDHQRLKRTHKLRLPIPTVTPHFGDSRSRGVG